MHVIADLCLIPIGVGVSVSKEIAACERVFAEAGLKTKLHSYGTNIEGELMKQDMEEAKVSWDGVHAVLYKTAWLDSVKVVWSEVAAHLEDSTAVEAAETTD